MKKLFSTFFQAYGFSAVELLVALAILGILLASGTIYTRNTIKSRELNATANLLSEELKELHLQAKTRQALLAIAFSENCLSSKGAPTQKYFCLPKALQFSDIAFAKSKPGATTQEIKFYPDGSVSPGHLKIHLPGTINSPSCTITISRLGRVTKVCDEL